MPASLDKNLRSGYLQEELGVFLLRGFASLAPVPRPEDSGIDTIATLLRQSTSRKLVPENTFYVQLKAASVSEITFTQDELDWLSQLQLPYLIGSVDRLQSKIELFTTHNWRNKSCNPRARPTKLILNRSILSAQRGNHAPSHDDPTAAELGPPILTWSVSDMGQTDFIERSYSVLKPHLEAEDRNIRWRNLNCAETLEWATGQPPRRVGWIQTNLGLGADLSSLMPNGILPQLDQALQHQYAHGMGLVLSEILTPIRALVSHALHNGSQDDFDSVYRFVQFMRSQGHDPACGNWVENIAKARFPNSEAASSHRSC